MKIKQLLNIGQKFYHWRPQKIINYRWMPVFLLRYFIYRKEISILENHFAKTEIGQKFVELHFWIWLQFTRETFYIGSTIKERVSYIINTWNFIQDSFTDEARRKMYCDLNSAIVLWEQRFEENSLRIELNYIDGEMKEGCATISLVVNDLSVHHMNFWISEFNKTDNRVVAYIGCSQGPIENGLDIDRELTKTLYGCRPKNFVLVALQHLLSNLGVTQLFAVSNKGHYSNKFVGDKRKPKVSYDEFWTECGGKLCEDPRFFSLPLEETRKTYEEIPSKKRSAYRKRYELLDQLSDSIKKYCLNNKANNE